MTVTAAMLAIAVAHIVFQHIRIRNLAKRIGAEKLTISGLNDRISQLEKEAVNTRIAMRVAMKDRC